MGSSVIGGNKAAFMAANMARYGYMPPAKPKPKAKPKKSTGGSGSNYVTVPSDDEMSEGTPGRIEELMRITAVRPEPVAPEEFLAELTDAKKVIEKYGEHGILNDESGFFTYWMRRELLMMRGTRTTMTRSNNVNVLRFVADISYIDDSWWFAIDYRLKLKGGNPVKELSKYIRNHFPVGEINTEDRRIRVWFPFGHLDRTGFWRICSWGDYHEAKSIKQITTPLRVLDFLNIHYLAGVECNVSYVRLHPTFQPSLSARDKADEDAGRRQNLLNALWK